MGRPSSLTKPMEVSTVIELARPPIPARCDDSAWVTCRGESELKKSGLKTVRSAPASSRNGTSSHRPSARHTIPGTTGLVSPSSQSSHLPLIRIDAMGLFTQDVTNVRHFVWILLVGESLDFFAAVGNK